MAARFRKIDPRIWTDEGFRQLTSIEQLIALYMLTAQSNRIGLFLFSAGKASDDLRISSRRLRNAFETVCRTFDWRYDDVSRVLYIPSWWKYNPPENANNVIANLKDLADLPRNPFLSAFSQNLTYLDEPLHETFAQTLAKRYPQPSPSQEQEQEQASSLQPTGMAAGQSKMLTAEDIRQRWNVIPGVKPCKLLGTTIRIRIQARLEAHVEPLWWDQLFDQVRASDFLCGRTNGPHGTFRATLDWTLRPNNLDKILAGNYDNGHPGRKERLPL